MHDLEPPISKPASDTGMAFCRALYVAAINIADGKPFRLQSIRGNPALPFHRRLGFSTTGGSDTRVPMQRMERVPEPCGARP